MKLFLTLLCCLSINLLLAQTQVGEDIDGENAFDEFGYSVSISDDGNRIAIGAPENDDNGANSGHARIFELVNGEWIQMGANFIGEELNDRSGTSVAISGDGTRVAIGAINNTGINGNLSGHTRIFEWNNNQWTQLGNDIDGENEYDKSGASVSLSADGNRVAIGASWNTGNFTASGHTRVFECNNNQWVQLGLDIDGEDESDRAGYSLDLSADGNHVAIGAFWNDGNGVKSGHTRIYEWNNNQWTQLGLDIDGENAGDNSGYSVAISADGSRVIIGALWNDPNGNNSGHARIFEWNNNQWAQVGLDIDGENSNDNSGNAVAISADGNRVAIGAQFTDGKDGTAFNSGEVKIFEWNNNQWTQQGEIIHGENPGDSSGYAVSITADGNRVAIGAINNGGITGHTRVFDLSNPNLTSNDLCFTLYHNPSETQYILEGDFTNCNIFVLDENENVVQFLLNIFDKIIIELDDLPAGLHFIRVEHQQHDELFIQEIIKP